ncbi:MAG: glycosyltransferase family 4 protein [Proteobacteria bacterium]|nr:glycosyltransferase family 4 protein [Pseudomonadota bacterium]
MSPPVRLAYLVTHPIQYQAPLLRLIANQPDIALHVMFGSDYSVRSFVDPGFNRAITWDVPLLDGYSHEVLPAFGRPLAETELPSFWRPFSRGVARRLEAGRFDALWVHGYNRASHWAAMLAAKRLGLAVLVRDEATEVSAARSLPKRIAKQAFFRTLDRLSDGFLAIGSLNRDYYLAHGIASAKLFTMPYAVDNAFFQGAIGRAAPERAILRARLGLAPDRPIILFAAKLIERKRPFDLLEAYATVAREPAARAPYLLFVGDGALKTQLEASIARRDFADARVLGFQSQAQLGALYDLAEVLVLPSERESWGLVINEAMNAGCAIIASDRVGAAADLVRGGDNGFVYPCGDVAALAVSLRAVLRDPTRGVAMGARSRELIGRWSFAEDLAGLRAALAACVHARTATEALA